jgi:hypothetical protein
MPNQELLKAAMDLAIHLRDSVGEIADIEASRRQRDWVGDDAETWFPKFPQESDGIDWRGVGWVAEDIHNLNCILEKADFNERPPQTSGEEFFSLGTINAYGVAREIHRGFVQPVLRLPVSPRLPDRVIAFLVTIPGDDEWLHRENHFNLGYHYHYHYHYHYLNARKQRSDVVVCWDIRATPQTPHPLFQEKHGEAHSKFSGRPDLWGTTKRKSINKACASDLRRWPLDKFRMASDTASPVWPLGAVLTPRPASSIAMPPRSGKVRPQRR